MSGWIELHGLNGEPYWVQVAHIVGYRASDDGCIIWVVGGSVFGSQESYSEIRTLIQRVLELDAYGR